MLWKLVAFVARYGKQPIEPVLEMTLDDLRELADAIAGLMREEAEAMQPKGI